MASDFDPWLTAQATCEVAGAACLDVDALLALTTSRLRRLLRTASERSVWYRRTLHGHALDGISPQTLGNLPVTRKADLMSNFNDWVTDPSLSLEGLRRFVADHARIGEPYLGRYIVWASSGSSGAPGIFVQDAASMAVYDALQSLRQPRSLRCWMNPFFLGERIAFIGSTQEHAASMVWLKRLQRLNPGGALCIHSLSFLQPWDELLRQLHRLAPTVVSTYACTAMRLAESVSDGKLKIAPREIWTGGETLTPAMRSLVHETFGCPVVDSYGCSEFFPMAFECPYGHLHLNSDWVILEPVDENGRPTPSGHLSYTALLTNLANLAQPLIRYDLGDRVTLHSQPCVCGSRLPVIEVHGRSDDVLCLRAARGHSVSIPPLALSTVLEEDGGIFDFQLIQRGPAQLELRTTPQSGASPAMRRRAQSALSAFLGTQGVHGVQIACTAQPALQPGHSGKMRRVIALNH